MSHRLLASARFHEALLALDEQEAAEARRRGCGVCGGRLHVADYERKPRGAASSPPPLQLELSDATGGLALRPVESPHSAPPAHPALADRVLDALRDASAPLRVADIRARCRVRTESLVTALRELVDQQLVEHTADGYTARN